MPLPTVDIYCAPDGVRVVSTDQLVQCQWFVLCPNPATETRAHPTLGDVPICQRCNRRVS